jgi:hypothetical protein
MSDSTDIHVRLVADKFSHREKNRKIKISNGIIKKTERIQVLFFLLELSYFLLDDEKSSAKFFMSFECNTWHRKKDKKYSYLIRFERPIFLRRVVAFSKASESQGVIPSCFSRRRSFSYVF